MNFKRPYPTDIEEIEMLELTLESPSPVHGIPYKDLDLRGWIYWAETWGAWAYVAEMDPDIGITCHYLHGKSFNRTTHDRCIVNIDRPSKGGSRFEAIFISGVHMALNGVRHNSRGFGGRPTVATCAFA